MLKFQKVLATSYLQVVEELTFGTRKKYFLCRLTLMGMHENVFDINPAEPFEVSLDNWIKESKQLKKLVVFRRNENDKMEEKIQKFITAKNSKGKRVALSNQRGINMLIMIKDEVCILRVHWDSKGGLFWRLYEPEKKEGHPWPNNGDYYLLPAVDFLMP